MKTLTIVFNFVLLGLIGIGILTSGLPEGTGSLISGLLAGLVLILNITIVAGIIIRTDANFPAESSNTGARKKRWSGFLFLKIFAILLNSVALAIVCNKFPNGSGYLFPYFMAFVIVTLLLSITMTALGRWNSFKGLKKTILSAGIILSLLLIGTFTTFRIMIGNGIKENIRIAKKEFPGKAEDALLAYLADSTKSPQDRTNIAVWTLGQIRSEKALPVLNALYKNYPEGVTCRHNSELCQYEIHKAIVSIESNWMGSKEKNVFGSWSRLNR